MKRFRRLMRQCPLAVCILGCWGILAAGKYLPLLKQQWEQEQAGPRPADAREGLEGYGAYGGAMAANRAPDLTLEELGQANPGASDFGTGGQEPQADVQANPEGSGEGSAQKEARRRKRRRAPGKGIRRRKRRRIPGKSIRRSRRRSCRSIFPTTRKKRIPPIIRIRERSR